MFLQAHALVESCVSQLRGNQMHGMGEGPWQTDEGTCRVLCDQILDRTSFGKHIKENGGGWQVVLNQMTLALMPSPENDDVVPINQLNELAVIRAAVVQLMVAQDRLREGLDMLEEVDEDDGSDSLPSDESMQDDMMS